MHQEAVDARSEGRPSGTLKYAPSPSPAQLPTPLWFISHPLRLLHVPPLTLNNAPLPQIRPVLFSPTAPLRGLPPLPLFQPSPFLFMLSYTPPPPTHTHTHRKPNASSMTGVGSGRLDLSGDFSSRRGQRWTTGPSGTY